MAFDNVMRHTILTVAGNRVVAGFAKRFCMRLGASRFVAGDTLEEAIEVIRNLNAEGMVATIDHLGESVEDPDQARAAAKEYLVALDKIQASGVNSNVSVKLTQMGLDIDKELCLDNMRRILDKATELGNSVRVDMEDSDHTEITIQVFEALAEEYNNVGLVVQSYLYRTEEDIERVNKYNANLRLCKGAYNEPPDVAFPQKADVDRNLRKLIARHLENGNYAAVASHDEKIIAFTKKYVADHNVPYDQFEFQMLYGIRRDLQKELVDEGYTVRVYVPYGTDWYPYFTRRLAERPANLFFILKNVVKP